MMPSDSWELHRSGPWLVVATSVKGISARIVEEIQNQCNARGALGVDTEVVGIDQIPPNLAFYKGMVLVFPIDQIDPQADDQLVSLLQRYRKIYARGVPALFGQPIASWYEVGAVQVVGEPRNLDHPLLRQAILRGQVCAVHRVDAGFDFGEMNLFAMYDPTHTTKPHNDAQAKELLRDGLDYLRSWTMPVTPRAIADARTIIAAWIKRYDDPQYKPVPGDRNRLQWVIDEPESRGPTAELAEDADQRKQWQENGRNAATDVVNGLKAAFPDLKRPKNREGKKGLMIDFSALSTTLDTVADLMSYETSTVIEQVEQSVPVHE